MCFAADLMDCKKLLNCSQMLSVKAIHTKKTFTTLHLWAIMPKAMEIIVIKWRLFEKACFSVQTVLLDLASIVVEHDLWRLLKMSIEWTHGIFAMSSWHNKSIIHCTLNEVMCLTLYRVHHSNVRVKHRHHQERADKFRLLVNWWHVRTFTELFSVDFPACCMIQNVEFLSVFLLSNERLPYSCSLARVKKAGLLEKEILFLYSGSRNVVLNSRYIFYFCSFFLLAAIVLYACPEC